MNDLGLTLAWSAVQVSLVLMPAAALYALASRCSPASGAWVAAMSLGLVVAFGLLTLAPRGVTSAPATARLAASKPVATTVRSNADAGKPRSDDGDGPGWSIAKLRGVWERFEMTASAPAERCRRWGSALAAFALAGTGVGLLRLIVGVWAVHVCRRRSRLVNDLGLNDLVEELRGSLGCRRRVEVREAPELTTPATAGWRRAVVLLPDDWRSWDRHERRAVFAHELAHVCRDDYVMGLVARVALALYFYHPLVHWLAARLQLEQELAADAIGARFAGGRTLYLQSLSRLALRQDGRSPCWPARAFLPAKGTLIRRIAMLRDETKSSDRPWSGPRRTLTALLLLAVAGGVLSLPGPVRGDDDDAKDDAVKTVNRQGSTTFIVTNNDDAKDGAVKTVNLTPQPVDKDRVEPFDLSYLPDDAQCVVAFRPRATFGRAGMGVYRTMLNLLIGQQWSLAANKLGFDPAKPGQGPLRVEMFEQVATVASFSRTGGKKPDGRFELGNVISAKTTEPIDWVTLFRAWKQDLTEVHEGDRVYYKVNNPALGPDGGFFCPDDRTIVFASEKRLLKLLRRETPAPAPAFANGKDWDKFLRGLLVVAFDNRDGRLAKVFKSDEPEDDDFDVAALFEHADLWTFGVDNGDQIVFEAVATCPDAVVSESIARATETLLDAVRKAARDNPEPTKPPHREQEKKARQMAETFFKKAHVTREGRSVLVRSAGLGTIADFASLVAADVIK